MSELLDFEKIRELSDNYYQQRIAKEEYRRQRTQLLNKIDKELNDIEPVLESDDSESGFVDKVMSFFRNSDEETIL